MVTNLKIALAQLNPLVGDVIGNVDKLISVRSNLDDSVNILVAPELYISGYPIDDLVLREDFLDLVCLLYTSPSPRDLSTSRMPSSA